MDNTITLYIWPDGSWRDSDDMSEMELEAMSDDYAVEILPGNISDECINEWIPGYLKRQGVTRNKQLQKINQFVRNFVLLLLNDDHGISDKTKDALYDVLNNTQNHDIIPCIVQNDNYLWIRSSAADFLNKQPPKLPVPGTAPKTTNTIVDYIPPELLKRIEALFAISNVICTIHKTQLYVSLEDYICRNMLTTYIEIMEDMVSDDVGELFSQAKGKDSNEK